jgi:hypothetical protein
MNSPRLNYINWIKDFLIIFDNVRGYAKPRVAGFGRSAAYLLLDDVSCRFPLL